MGELRREAYKKSTCKRTREFTGALPVALRGNATKDTVGRRISGETQDGLQGGRMQKVIFSLLAIAAIGTASAGFAAEPRHPIDLSGSYTSDPWYLNCVGEMVTVTVNYESRFQYFETASGSVHMLDKWTYSALYTSESGRQWYGTGVSPFVNNTRLDKGQVLEWVSVSKMNPLDGGPRFIHKVVFKLIVNANGDVTAEKPYPEGADYKCLPPKD